MQETDSSSLHHQLAVQVGFAKQSSVEVGKLLHDLRLDDNYLTAVGDGVETWQSYLAQPEIGLSVSEANRLIQIYEVFILRWEFEEAEIASIPTKNLHTLLPIAKTIEVGPEGEEELRALVNDATHLSQRDFKERLHDVKTNDDGVRTYEYVIMKKCIETGSMRKVHEYSSSDVDVMMQRYNDD